MFSCICTCVRNGPWQFACGLFWALVIISTKIDIEASILEVKIDAQTGYVVRDTMMVAVQRGFPCEIGLVVGLLLMGRAITVNLSLISLCRGEACSRKSLEGLIRRIVW